MPRKLKCAVESIVDHGGRVYTIELRPERPVPNFLPGQFLHLAVDDFDPAGFWPESRVFSIASSPAERERVRICYSVKGLYTEKMERILAVGRHVWIKLPYGDFLIQPSAEVVLFAGGTGISAFAAFVEALMPGSTPPVTLVYGARSPELLLFSEMILAKSADVVRFNVIFFTETTDSRFAERVAGLPRVPCCYSGRISIDAVLRLLPSDLRPLTSDSRLPPSVLFYLAGPPVMISTLTSGLRHHGVASEQIRIDAWE